MIEVIVKFLTTSATRKTSSISHAATPTTISNPKESVTSPTTHERIGAYKTAGPDRTEGLNSSVFKKNKMHQDIDLQMTTGKGGSHSQHGKPITKSSTSSPLSHEFSSSHPTPSHLLESTPSYLTKVSQSMSQHLDKTTYPQAEVSPLKESRGSGSTVEPKKHSTSLLQKDRTSIMNVKPRGGVPSPLDGSGGGITVASGHVASSRPTSNTRSSARGVLKSVHISSMTSREPPTLKPDNKAESAKQKPHQGRHTYRDSTSNKEVTVTQDEIITRLKVTNCKFYKL